MPQILVYDQSRSEIDLIRDRLSDFDDLGDEIDFYGVQTLQELLKTVKTLREIPLCCTDFDAGGEDAVAAVRAQDPASLIIIIAGRDTSPLLYIRPGIMASGLMLRPLGRDQVSAVLTETMDVMRARLRERLFNNELFAFSTREGVMRVPYSKILYFEARDKKIILCTARSESAFYSTLETLGRGLPDYFLRCHKGFIVNTLLVNKVDLGRSSITLLGGFSVPVSRSYRSSVKEALSK